MIVKDREKTGGVDTDKPVSLCPTQCGSKERVVFLAVLPVSYTHLDVYKRQGSKGKSYAEYQAEKAGTSWKGKLKIAVDTLIPQVASFEELLQRLQAAGYEIKPGKYISCRAPGQDVYKRQGYGQVYDLLLTTIVL